ncbi:cell division cycle protein 123 homolog [Ischnura elegans]|uniref:cell division cycle protein 123 homolog n=1 Tax=Ischnura elegans TaxID=197161 RepID=UPI001ED89378|nr:cell division cycle protein 123 homolog [Ischnura elegans]
MAKTGVNFEYLQCSYESWYNRFKGDVHDSSIVHVPANVLSYLLSDVMVLPKNCSITRQRKEIPACYDAEEELEEPEFPDFNEKLKEAIQGLGGKVFVKLNWSAPKDASWITSTRSLCCSDPADIYLLLKSSSYISDDLSVLKEVSETSGDVPCCLVLKKWIEIHPGTEYRCFVVDKNLVGVCQRDTTSYFKYIGDNKDSILELIINYFQDHIKPKFPLNNYTFDIILALGMKINLVDFGLLNKNTDCLLFSWKELKKRKCGTSTKTPLSTEKEHSPCDRNQISSCCKPEFRYIDEFTNVPRNQCKHYGIPMDVMHFCSGEKNVADYIQEEILNNSL